MSAVNPAGAHGLTNSQGNEVATASQRLCCRRCVVRWTRNSEYGQENNWTHPKDPSLTCISNWNGDKCIRCKRVRGACEPVPAIAAGHVRCAMAAIRVHQAHPTHETKFLAWLTAKYAKEMCIYGDKLAVDPVAAAAFAPVCSTQVYLYHKVAMEVARFAYDVYLKRPTTKNRKTAKDVAIQARGLCWTALAPRDPEDAGSMVIYNRLHILSLYNIAMIAALESPSPSSLAAVTEALKEARDWRHHAEHAYMPHMDPIEDYVNIQFSNVVPRSHQHDSLETIDCQAWRLWT